MAFPYPSKRRRAATREDLWPEGAALVWPQPKERPFSDGWAKMPKYLPAILAILSNKDLSEGMDLAPVYIELLSRLFDEGLVELSDEDEHAYLSGLSSVKTWRKRLRQLEALGLLKTFERVPGKLGYVILVHPLHAIVKLYKDGKVEEKGWRVLKHRLIELNIDLDKAIQYFSGNPRPPPKRGVMARLRGRQSTLVARKVSGATEST